MRNNKKIICIGAIKAVSFLVIFLILFQGATNLFRQKVMYYSISSIYDLPRDSVDVLFLGSSHMYASISPMDLWNDYGITSYNASVGLLSLPCTYFELRELLKVQSPKVVVLDIFYIHSELPINDDARFHYIVDNIPFSFGLSEAIQTLIAEDVDKTQYYLNFYTFHNRWKELSESDFKPWITSTRYNRGGNAAFYNQHSAMESLNTIPRSETETPPELPLEYLYKIIELCREKEISLLFVAQPCGVGSYMQKTMNYIDFVAEEEDIPYLNFLYLYDETGFDLSKDMADAGHVNYFGAQKLTSYLGEYLQANYQLEDHRGNSALASLWDKDYELFAREINNVMMKTAEDADEYFQYLRRGNYIIVWNAYSEVPILETALPGFLERMGLDTTGSMEGNWYRAVTNGSQMLHGGVLDIRPNDSYFVDDTLFSFGDGINKSTNLIGIHVGRKECSVGNTGLNIAVYDPVTRTVVDNVNIDLDTEGITRK